MFILPVLCVLTAFALRGTRYLISVNAELVEARDELARSAVAEERLRFARDLHDLLGHSLSLIALKSELAGRLAERDPARARQEMADVEAAARRALAEVRDAVSGYRQVSLAQALAEARSALSAAGHQRCARRARGEPLPAAVDAVLGWVVREATTNVLRHSGAPRGDRRARTDDDGVTLTVSDDGAGRRRAGGRGAGRARRACRGARWPAGGRPGGRPGLPARRAAAAGARAADRRRPVIRVLIAEDQALVRGALAGAARAGGRPRGRRRGRPRATRSSTPRREHRPDVALLDIEMPGGDGIEAARAGHRRARLPGGHPHDVRPPGLPPPGHGGRRGRLPGQGRAGRRARPRHPRGDGGGARHRPRRWPRRRWRSGATPLSTREADVLRGGADGATVADIAGRLFLSEGTVRNYLSSAIGKTGARNRVEAARVAEEKGWL